MRGHLISFHRQLHRWYGQHGRHSLPWRNTGDPYAIYISEVMLQQTQVKTVLERYYFPFLKRFPTLRALAQADRQDVLQAWQGLGYYNRAVKLHEAARQCGGALPETAEGLMALPGIGRNTANAVAAFAFRQPVAVMEANVKRVLSRIFALSDPKEDELWEKAALLLDKRQPFNYNQAMMDLGAMLCTRSAPACQRCPAQAFCRGKASPELYPAPRAKKAVRLRHKNIIVMRNRKGQFFATPRASRFLNGLFQFIETDADASRFRCGNKSYSLENAIKLGDIRQQYSHFTLEAGIWLHEAGGTGNHWYGATELSGLPMSMAEQKILKLLGIGQNRHATA